MNIGRLEVVPIRELWSHEERGFSAWLHENLEELSKALGIELSDPQREVLAGRFQCDLVTSDSNGNRVIIENQLEPTNHDHFGKLLTYVSNLEAKTAIWIATDHRPEHIKGIQWLNEISPEDVSFFMVKLAAYKIAGSEIAAPMFTVIVGPSREIKSFGEQKKELADRWVKRERFWEGLLALARVKGVLSHAQRSPSMDNWLSAGAGVRSGISFTYLIWMDSSAVELSIDTGDGVENESIFSALEARKGTVEEAFGHSLIWDRMLGKRGCRIRYELSDGGLNNEDRWPDIQEAMVTAMAELARAIRPHLNAVITANL